MDDDQICEACGHTELIDLDHNDRVVRRKPRLYYHSVKGQPPSHIYLCKLCAKDYRLGGVIMTIDQKKEKELEDKTKEPVLDQDRKNNEPECDHDPTGILMMGIAWTSVVWIMIFIVAIMAQTI